MKANGQRIAWLTRLSRRALLCGCAIALATWMGGNPSAQALDYILHTFTGDATDGGSPYSSLTLSGSTLYGITEVGGPSGNGVVFSMNTGGTGYSILHAFAGNPGDGRYATGSLLLSGSTLYGVTYSGGSNNDGTVYSMNTDGTGYTELHNFNGSDGFLPMGGVTLVGSKLYGMTTEGGTNNRGAIFSMNTNGTGFAVLHSFSDATGDGKYPNYTVLTAIGSTLYGMTGSGGGTNNGGTIFSINADGTGFTLLHSFNGGSSDGSLPDGSLTLFGSKLYGLTSHGGSGDIGTMFSINPDGSGFSVLYSFDDVTAGLYPFGSLTLGGSKFYGTTETGAGGGVSGGVGTDGTVFSINTDGTGATLLHNFAGGSADGAIPEGNITVSSQGWLYGLTTQGGSANKGTLFLMPEPNVHGLLAGGMGLMFALWRRKRHK